MKHKPNSLRCENNDLNCLHMENDQINAECQEERSQRMSKY